MPSCLENVDYIILDISILMSKGRFKSKMNVANCMLVGATRSLPSTQGRKGVAHASEEISKLSKISA